MTTKEYAAEKVIAAARAVNEEASYGEVTERARAALSNALLDYDKALASVSSGDA